MTTRYPSPYAAHNAIEVTNCGDIDTFSIPPECYTVDAYGKRITTKHGVVMYAVAVDYQLPNITSPESVFFFSEEEAQRYVGKALLLSVQKVFFADLMAALLAVAKRDEGIVNQWLSKRHYDQINANTYKRNEFDPNPLLRSWHNGVASTVSF